MRGQKNIKLRSVLVLFCRCPIYHKERRCCLDTDWQKYSSFRSRPNWPITRVGTL